MNIKQISKITHHRYKKKFKLFKRTSLYISLLMVLCIGVSTGLKKVENQIYLSDKSALVEVNQYIDEGKTIFNDISSLIKEKYANDERISGITYCYDFQTTYEDYIKLDYKNLEGKSKTKKEQWISGYDSNSTFPVHDEENPLLIGRFIQENETNVIMLSNYEAEFLKREFEITMEEVLDITLDFSYQDKEYKNLKIVGIYQYEKMFKKTGMYVSLDIFDSLCGQWRIEVEDGTMYMKGLTNICLQTNTSVDANDIVEELKALTTNSIHSDLNEIVMMKNMFNSFSALILVISIIIIIFSVISMYISQNQIYELQKSFLILTFKIGYSKKNIFNYLSYNLIKIFTKRFAIVFVLITIISLLVSIPIGGYLNNQWKVASACIYPNLLFVGIIYGFIVGFILLSNWMIYLDFKKEIKKNQI